MIYGISFAENDEHITKLVEKSRVTQVIVGLYGNPQSDANQRIISEESLEFTHDAYSAADAICWAPGRTIGNIAVKSDEVLGIFDGKSGDDAILPCQIIPCGKFRNGAKRWYCKTRQLQDCRASLMPRDLFAGSNGRMRT